MASDKTIKAAAKILAAMTFAAHSPGLAPLWDEDPDATESMRDALDRLRVDYLARSMPYAQALADAGVLAPGDAEVRAKIARQVRDHCTVSTETAMIRNTDMTVQAVADRIANPPEWVKVTP